MKTTMTIATSDSSGGAGIQADIKTITCNGVFATSAIASLTSQNTLAVYETFCLPPNFLFSQIKAIVEDIPPDSVKIGLLPNIDLIMTVAKAIKDFSLKKIVIDPVMKASTGANFMQDDMLLALKKELLPYAQLVTPNISEAEKLSQIKIKSKSDMQQAAKIIAQECNCAVLCKSGHSALWDKDAGDFLYYKKNNIEKQIWFYSERVNNPNTHGTGCTLSSAIAANLAKGFPLENAIKLAKDYILGALKAALNLGRGSGPLNHAYMIAL